MNIEFKPRKAFARLGGSKLQEFQISNVICENDEDDVGGGDEGHMMMMCQKRKAMIKSYFCICNVPQVIKT